MKKIHSISSTVSILLFLASITFGGLAVYNTANSTLVLISFVLFIISMLAFIVSLLTAPNDETGFSTFIWID